MPCTLPASLADAAVCRGSFHAVLGGEAGEAVFADFSAALQKAQAEGRILTASLFRYENHLFFYAEGLNRPFTPQGLCPALDAALLPWPPALGETAPRPWAAMQPYFYHDVPTTAADWQRGRCPQRRRNIIACIVIGDRHDVHTGRHRITNDVARCHLNSGTGRKQTVNMQIGAQPLHRGAYKLSRYSRPVAS